MEPRFAQSAPEGAFVCGPRIVPAQEVGQLGLSTCERDPVPAVATQRTHGGPKHGARAPHALVRVVNRRLVELTQERIDQLLVRKILGEPVIANEPRTDDSVGGQGVRDRIEVDDGLGAGSPHRPSRSACLASLRSILALWPWRSRRCNRFAPSRRVSGFPLANS